MDYGMRSNNIRNNTSSKGFTLVELLIAMALMSIITIAVYQLYISQYKTWVAQDLVTEVQQNARISIDTISRDLLMTGYGVTTQIETGSNPTQLSIRYRDPSTSVDPITRVTYRRGTVGSEANVLYRREDRAASEAALPLLDFTSGGSPLSENITALTFTYFNANGVVMTSSYQDAYRIKVTLTAQTSKNDPITGNRKNYTLSTDARPRNIGIGNVGGDTTPPPKPTIRPTVTDPDICNTLNVSWTAVSDPDGDLAGYNIYYGTSPGDYTKKVSVGKVTSTTLSSLTNGTTYYIAYASRDAVGNVSDYSPAAFSGDGTANDTTLNVDAPGQPVGLDATASASGSPQVFLTWTLNSTTYATSPGILHTLEPAPAPGGTAGPGYGPDTDVGSYEIWRSPDNVTWTEIAPSTAKVGPAYTDSTIGESSKCTMFYYKIRAVNSCDPNQKSPFSATVVGDGGRSATVDLPTDGVTNTMPSDATKPAAPTNAFSKAGFGRTYMNWDNPSDADLDHVVIRYNSAFGSTPAYPNIVSEPPVVLDGTPIENGTADGRLAKTSIGTVYNGGSFEPGATALSFTHFGSIVESPELLAGHTYAYSIFAVDKCGNVSDPASTAQTTVGQCGEETEAVAPGNPTIGAPRWTADNSNFTLDACSQYKFYFDRINDTYPTGVYDLAGYYVYRRQSTTPWTPSSGDQPGYKYKGLILNPPSGNLDFTDFGTNPDTDTAFAGNTYQYYTIPIDCNREQNSNGAIAKNPWAPIAEAPDPAPKASEVITVRPGMPTFRNSTSVTSGDLGLVVSENNQSYYGHTNVNLRLDNTSASSVWVKSINLSWNNSSSLLSALYQRIGTSLSWITNVGSISPATITFNPPIEIKGKSDPLYGPLMLWPNFNSDARDYTITINSIEYLKTFDKDGTTIYPTCTISAIPAPSSYNVPIGPVVSNTSQNRTSTVIDTAATPSVGVINSLPPASDVNVSTHVEDTSFAGIQSVKLYYKVTDKSVDVYTSIPDYQTFSAWTELSMSNISGGDYALFNTITNTGNKIPHQAGQRVWYFIVAVNNKGNFDREPEITANYPFYTYDHMEVDPCTVTPSPVADLGGSVAGSTIDLTWTASAGYTNGDTLYVGDSFKYRVYRRANFAGAYSQPASGGCSGDVSTAGCTDNDPALDPTVNNYSYIVYVINSCASAEGTDCTTGAPVPPDPPVAPYCSANSNRYNYCVSSDLALNPLNPVGPITAGSSFTVSVNNCNMAGNSAMDSQSIDSATSSVDTFSYSIVEDVSDNGTFSRSMETVYPVPPATCATAATPAHPDKICVNPTWSTNDSVTITLSGATPSSRTIVVTKNACSEAPVAPTGLTLTNAQVNGNNVDTAGRIVNLQWTANTEGDISTYSIYRSKNGAAAALLGSTAATTYADTLAVGDAEGTYYTYYIVATDSCSLVSANSGTVGPVYRSCSSSPASAPALTLTNAVPAYDDNSGNVGLSWTNLGLDIENYIVSRSTDGGTTWPTTFTVTAPTVTYTDSAPGAENATVKYKVKAVDRCNKSSADSNIVTITKSCSVVPNAPTGLTNAYGSDVKPGNPNKGTASLSWTGSTSADVASYKVYIYVAGVLKSTTNVGNVTSWVTPDLTAAPYSATGLVVKIDVSTVDKCPRESSMATINVYPGGCSAAPAAPATPTVTNVPNTLDKLTGGVPNGSVGLSWARNTEVDIDHYNVYRSVNGGAYNVLAAIAPQVTAGNVTYTDPLTGLNEGDTVSYKIAAVDNCSLGAQTSPQSNASAPLVRRSCSMNPTASTLSVTNDTVNASYSNSYDMPDGQVKLSWTANANGDFASFDIYRKINAGAWSASIYNTTSAAAGSYTDPAPGGSEGDTITYKIVTTDACGNTTESGTISVTKSCSVTPATPSMPLTYSSCGDGDDMWRNVTLPAAAPGDLATVNVYYCPSPVFTGDTVTYPSTGVSCGGAVLLGSVAAPAGGGSFDVCFPLPDADAPAATWGAYFAVTVTDACGKTSPMSGAY